jgi:hypothetical protein
MMAVVGPLHQSVDGLAENVGPAGVAESVLDRVDQGTAEGSFCLGVDRLPRRATDLPGELRAGALPREHQALDLVGGRRYVVVSGAHHVVLRHGGAA